MLKLYYSIKILTSSILYFIDYIDSRKLDSLFDKETLHKPVLFSFENEGSRQRDNQYAKLQTEYRLFTYLNNTKYYLDMWLEADDLFDLRSTESKNMFKGCRHI